MLNPMPVERFTRAEAIRRTWPQLIEAMLEAVCLVEPEGLRIVAANDAAGRLLGVSPGDLVGRDMHELASTPEDEAFWAEVAEGLGTGIESDSFVSHAGLAALPVTRRVSRIEPAPGMALYVVALRDRSAEVEAERANEMARAELEATLESLDEGVLVTDLEGHIRRFNRRFAALWSIPHEMLLPHVDDEVFDWMRRQVVDASHYMRRLAEIDASPLLQTTDRLDLRSGGALERVTTPQSSRGRAIGRVFTFRRLR